MAAKAQESQKSKKRKQITSAVGDVKNSNSKKPKPMSSKFPPKKGSGTVSVSYKQRDMKSRPEKAQAFRENQAPETKRESRIRAKVGPFTELLVFLLVVEFWMDGRVSN